MQSLFSCPTTTSCRILTAVTNMTSNLAPNQTDYINGVGNMAFTSRTSNCLAHPQGFQTGLAELRQGKTFQILQNSQNVNPVSVGASISLPLAVVCGTNGTANLYYYVVPILFKTLLQDKGWTLASSQPVAYSLKAHQLRTYPCQWTEQPEFQMRVSTASHQARTESSQLVLLSTVLFSPDLCPVRFIWTSERAQIMW